MAGEVEWTSANVMSQRFDPKVRGGDGRPILKSTQTSTAKKFEGGQVCNNTS